MLTCQVFYQQYLNIFEQFQTMHTLPKPHDLTCQVCEKQCLDDERFFRHIHKEHPDYWRVLSGGRPLTDFIEPREVRRKEKRYTCNVCNKRYTHETGYVKHLATHPSSKPTIKEQLYNCTVCEKIFTKEPYLLRHMEMKVDDQHRAALEELKKNSPMFRVSCVEAAPMLDLFSDGGDMFLPPKAHGQRYPLLRSISLDHRGMPDSFMQNQMKYEYRRSSSINSSPVNHHLDAANPNGMSSRHSNSGSLSPVTSSYKLPFSRFGDSLNDAYIRDGHYQFAFSNHLNQDRYPKSSIHDFTRNSYQQNTFYRSNDSVLQRSPPDEMRRRSPTDNRHSYLSPSYLPHSQTLPGGSASIHGMIPQGPFVHPSMDAQRYETSSGILDPYLQRGSNFSDHDVATALQHLARTLPGFR